MLRVVCVCAALMAWAKNNKQFAGKDFKALCAEPAVRQFLLQEMDKTGKARELRGFEFIKHIYVTHELFTAENGMLTPTFKVRPHTFLRIFCSLLSCFCL